MRLLFTSPHIYLIESHDDYVSASVPLTSRPVVTLQEWGWGSSLVVLPARAIYLTAEGGPSISMAQTAAGRMFMRARYLISLSHDSGVRNQ